MAFITIAGQNQIAKKQGDNVTLNIASFVLANVPDLGGEPATRIESIPNENVVDQLVVTKSGYVNTNQVVFSLVMGSDIGNYSFNWVGMVDDEGVLIAVTYIPLTPKTKNDGGVPGNTITRNFLLAYTGIQQTTAITVPAETWQIDFSARLSGIDERERLANLDIYGHEGFLDDGWKVTGSEGTYSVAAGIGYVGGIRAKNTAPQEITTATFPNEIWLNVSLQGDISDMTAVCEFVIDTGPFEDYVDGNGITHYITKIADIDAAGEVVEARKKPSLDSFRSYIEKIRKDEVYDKTVSFLETQGRKNLLINGSPQVWQRGEYFDSRGYCEDRWYNVLNSAVCTFDDAESASLITMGSGGNCDRYQFLESNVVKRCRNKKMTFSVRLGFDGCVGSYRLSCSYSNVSDASSAAQVAIESAEFSIASSGWIESITFTVPSDAVGLAVGIVLVDSQPAGAKMWRYDSQLEMGSTKTAFEHRYETEELLLCKRFSSLEEINGYVGLGNIYIYSGGASGGISYGLQVPLRATPALSIKSGYFYVGSSGPTHTATGVYVNNINKLTGTISINLSWSGVSPTGVYAGQLSFFLDSEL